MKKFIVILASLLLVGGAAFAEIFWSMNPAATICPFCAGDNLTRTNAKAGGYDYECNTCGKRISLEELMEDNSEAEEDETTSECADSNCSRLE